MKTLKLFAATLLLAFAGNSFAGVVLMGTRLVFPSSAADVTLDLTNEGKTPALIRAWIDIGDPSTRPDEIDVPFVISPPLFRMEAGKRHGMRVIHTGEKLAEDRETLFWLNVLEIPPKPDAAVSENYLQFAVRSRIKLFYRPAAIKASVAANAPDALKWRIESEDGELKLKIENPSPVHVSIVGINFKGVPDDSPSVMVAPLSTLSIPLKDAGKRVAGDERVKFKTVNDYGGYDDHETVASGAP